ncbi:Uncharacterised protein [Vibrio cholerae]|nr:Uncharacterised protein [Vibrio cholerae]CSB27530.1 Uncharacterised protein [Vibrio cholerae]
MIKTDVHHGLLALPIFDWRRDVLQNQFRFGGVQHMLNEFAVTGGI